MSAEDAEEYTRSLGQIMSGGWRQIALAQRLGVAQAIGMTTDAWVRERIGGYVRLGLDERREAVRELTDPSGEFQLSQRQAAEVLGIGKDTVRRDLMDGASAPPEADALEWDGVGDGADAPPEEWDEPAAEIGPSDSDFEPSPVVGDVRDDISAGFDDEAVAAEMDAARRAAEMTRVRATWLRFVSQYPPGVFADGLDRAELDSLLSDIERFIGWLERARGVAVAARRPWKVV